MDREWLNAMLAEDPTLPRPDYVAGLAEDEEPVAIRRRRWWVFGRRCGTCGRRVLAWKGAGAFGVEGNPPRRHCRCGGPI